MTSANQGEGLPKQSVQQLQFTAPRGARWLGNRLTMVGAWRRQWPRILSQLG